MVKFIVALMALVLFPGLVSGQDRYANFDGVKIRYIEQGAGEPVVLLHGGTSTLEFWSRTGVLADLSKDFRVIAFDARGAGKSDKPRDSKAYGRELAMDVVRLLDLLRIERAHILGYSAGANTAALLMTLHPERLLTATMGGSGGRRAGNDSFLEVEAGEIERECVSSSRIRRLAPPDFKLSDAEFRKRVDQCKSNEQFDQHAAAAMLRSLPAMAVTPAQLRSARVPTLGLVGSLDENLARLKELQAMFPEMKLIVIANATHEGQRTAARRPEFVAAFREFTAANKQAAIRQ